MNIANWQIERLKRQRNIIADETIPAVLGDNSGRVDVPNRLGFVYVRFTSSEDTNGNVTYSAPTVIRAGVGVAYMRRAGARVYVGLDFDGQPTIKGADFNELVELNISPTVSNPLATENRINQTVDNFIPLKSDAISTATTPATKANVQQLIYDTGDGDIAYFAGTNYTTHVDLSSYIPATDEHCYAVVWLDSYTNGLEVTASTAQSLFTALNVTDLQECFNARPPDSMPIKAYYLADAQTSVAQSFRHVDLRQMINTPSLWGFPEIVTKRTRIWDNQQAILHGGLTVRSYGVTTLGGLWLN